MSVLDYIITAAVVLWAARAVVTEIRNRKNGKCSGCCGDCRGCADRE